VSLRICDVSKFVVMASVLACSQPFPPSEGRQDISCGQACAVEQVSLFTVTADSCLSNRSSLISAEAMYYGAHDACTTDPDDLYELLGWVSKCPLSELECLIESPDPDSTCTVICPSNPSHGQTSPGDPWQ